jgi:hypothetical protein
VVKSPEKWNLQDWFLHHDNAPAHSAFAVHEFPAKNMAVVPHLPYSPDLVPCAFFLYPKLKIALKGRRFNTVTMIQAKSWDALAEFQTSDFALNGGAITQFSA